MTKAEKNYKRDYGHKDSEELVNIEDEDDSEDADADMDFEDDILDEE